MGTDEPEIPRQPAPPGLSVTGRRMWKRVTSTYVLRVDEQIVLESACRIAETIALLETAMRGQPLIVKGSMGQEREHPLLSEARQQRALLARMMGQLKLPDEGSQAYERSHHAREMAHQRWSKRGGSA